MNKKSLVAIALLAVSAISSAQSVYPGQHQGCLLYTSDAADD